MTAISLMSVERVERDLAPEASAAPGSPAPEVTPGGIALSATLHLGMLTLILIGLPSLFRHAPPQESPIAVELVTIAPETRATHPNPFRPRPDAKPEPPLAAPAPKPEPKPEPPIPAPQPPASAASAAMPAPPAPAPPEAKPAPPPPPPKPIEAQAPPPPQRPPDPRPKPEPQRPQRPTRAEMTKADPKAFDKLLRNLQDKRPEPAAFDNLLKNLTREQVAEAEEAPPQPRRMAATAPPSSQPKAPLGSQLSASDIDLVREQLRPCFNPPFGAKEKPDLVADIRVVMNRDGTVQQARILDQGQYAGDQIYRAVADSGIRALRNPRCSPLRLPPDRYDAWQTFIFGFSTKDMQ